MYFNCPKLSKDVITLANGFDFGTGSTPALRASGTTGGSSFSTVAFYNNTTVTIDTTTIDGNDTITITSASNNHQNTNLTINTGTGTDQININGNVIFNGHISMTTGGLFAFSGGPTITSANGNISLTAKIDITGTGANGTNANNGVFLENPNTTVESVTGDISIMGNGGNASGSDNTASIVIQGQGGTGVDTNYGVEFNSGAIVRTIGTGSISITGTGNTASTGITNHGVFIGNGALIESNNTGKITITGIAGGGKGNGVRFFTGGKVQALGNADIEINGTGNGGTNTDPGSADIFWDSLSFTKTGGTIKFNDTVLGTTSLTINAGAYNMEFNDGGLIANAVVFNNTGTVTLGNQNTDVITFTGGLNSQAASNTKTAGTINTTNTAMSLGNTTLTANTTLNAGTSNLNLGTVSGAFNLTVNFGGTGSAGAIAGLTSLTKQGTGTLTLAANNSYTGATTINGGTVLVNDDTSESNFTVHNGATLGGTGVVGQITVNNGGTISPGNSPGVLTTTNNFSLPVGANLNIELDTTDDQVSVIGTVGITGSTLNVDATNVVARKYIIVNNDATDSVVGTFAGLPEGTEITSINGANSNLKGFITYVGGTGNDVEIYIENYINDCGTITGTDVNDIITLANHCLSNLVHGGNGNDEITGSSTVVANDTFYGDSGDDILNGGLGTDYLYGGTGKDIFVLDRTLADQRDWIKDFSTTDDKIQIKNGAVPLVMFQVLTFKILLGLIPRLLHS